MRIDLRVSHWSFAVEVTVHELCVEYLRSQGFHRCSVMREGLDFILAKEPDTRNLGCVLRETHHDNPGSEWLFGYSFFEKDDHSGSGRRLEDLVRFSPYPVTAAEDGDYLSFSLPLQHQLPWPKLQECESFDWRELAAEELRRRLKSAYEHGDTAPHVPLRVRREFAGIRWRKILDEILKAP